MNDPIQLYKDGATISEIVAATGIVPTTLYRKLRAAGISKRKADGKKYTRLTNKDRELILKLYDDGASILTIIEQSGFSRTGIYNALKEAGYDCSQQPVFDDPDNPTQRKCSDCTQWKDLSEFSKSSHHSHGVTTACKACLTIRRRQRKLNNPIKVMLGNAKSRAKIARLEFSLTESDIIIPDVCPILGLPLKFSVGEAPTGNSPSIDRIDNSKGYIPGNIIIVSFRANALKRDATIMELRAIADFYESLTGSASAR